MTSYNRAPLLLEFELRNKDGEAVGRKFGGFLEREMTKLFLNIS
jgi:hypothetical protein